MKGQLAESPAPGSDWQHNCYLTQGDSLSRHYEKAFPACAIGVWQSKQ